MIRIYFDDLVHLVVQLVQEGEREGVLRRVPSSLIRQRLVGTFLPIGVGLGAGLTLFSIRLGIAWVTFEVHAGLLTPVAVALVVMDDTTCVASDQELIVLRELDASDSGLMIIDHVDWTSSSLVQLEDADFVVEVAAYVEIHVPRTASVIEVCE